MVSFYNHFAMYQKNHSGNLPYSASPSWYAGNYHHQPPNAQYMGDTDTPPQAVYYPHPHVFHQSSPDWAGHENFAVPPQSSLLPPSNGLHLNNQNGDHLAEGLHSIPSPPITVSGSDMSSPGAPHGGSASPHVNNARPTPVKSPYEWMKKPSYQTQPNPGKTRTKDKYRVVYTDHQRLELEKEFHYTRYITIRRKSELAQALALSERQVKIWFQNRRAKDRKQKKKIESGSMPSSQQQSMGSMGGHGQHNGQSSLSNLLDTKPKIEPSLHLQHLHQMGAIGMSMGPMGLHPAAAHHAALHSHHHLGMPPTSQHLSQQGSQQSSGALSII